MATNTPFYPGDTHWSYVKRWAWLMWVQYWSPLGSSVSTQYVCAVTKPKELKNEILERQVPALCQQPRTSRRRHQD